MTFRFAAAFLRVWVGLGLVVQAAKKEEEEEEEATQCHESGKFCALSTTRPLSLHSPPFFLLPASMGFAQCRRNNIFKVKIRDGIDKQQGMV